MNLFLQTVQVIYMVQLGLIYTIQLYPIQFNLTQLVK